MSKRAVIYARVSTDIQRGNYSIPSQVAACLHYAEERSYTLHGNQFVDPETGQDVNRVDGAIPAYVDDYTSRELSRPSLDAALAFLEAFGFDVLIVHAIDRLARDPYIRQTLEREFQAHGASVEYVLGDYDETPEGEVRKDLDATFAKWENAKRTERCVRGKKRKARSGKFVAGKPPYGYRLDPDSLGGLAIVPEQAEIVERVFDLYVHQHESMRAIVQMLNDERVPAYTKGVQWGKTSVSRMLKRTVYVGHYYFNQYDSKKKKRTLKPKSEWIKIPCTPIVDQETFDLAQDKRAHNKEVIRMQPKRFYLLTGMVFCSDCERPYAAQTSTPQKTPGKDGRIHRPYAQVAYRHRKSSGHCMNRHVSANWLEDEVWCRVLNLLLFPESLMEGYEQARAQQEVEIEKKRRLVETLEEALVKNKKKLQNLSIAYLDPDINMSKAEYLEQKELIETEEIDIQENLNTIHYEIKNLPRPADIENLEVFAKEIVEGLLDEEDEEISPEKKRMILEMLHIKIILSPERDIRLDGWFDPPPIDYRLLDPSSAHYAHPLMQFLRRV